MSFAFQSPKNALIVFEGSDWCASCIKFEKEILEDSTIINFLQENMIEVIKIDFPQRKKLSKEQEEMNKVYAEKFNFQGVFPTIVYTSSGSKDYYTFNSANASPQKVLDWLKLKTQLNK